MNVYILETKQWTKLPVPNWLLHYPDSDEELCSSRSANEETIHTDSEISSDEEPTQSDLDFIDDDTSDEELCSSRSTNEDYIPLKKRKF